MKALSCPKCGAPLPAAVPACPYCRVGLVAEPGEAPEPALQPEEETPASAEIPQGWWPYNDPWRGFSLAHPPGWQVVCLQGQISVREDPAGYVSAMIWPVPLQSPMTAAQLAWQITELSRQQNPSFQAWLQDNAAPDSPRVSVKVRQVRYGQPLEGLFNILVSGSNAIISGYSAPPQVVAQRSPLLGQILSTFRGGPLMPRQMVQDPTEGAFSLAVPMGWSFQGGVNRNNIGGSGACRFTVSMGQQGLVQAANPFQSWNFMEGMGGWLGALGGPQSRNFTQAHIFCQEFVAPWMAKFQQSLQLVSAVDRPDLNELGMLDMTQAGYPPGSYDASTAIMETVYYENGARLRQKSRVACLRLHGSYGMSTGGWNALMEMYYRAPDADFLAWEPVLTGIHESYKVNPAWKQGEQRLAQNYIMNSQQDIARRTRQISQTLSETSDIITSGYWNRQASYDRISEMRSNATLGVQNVASDDGYTYKVPNGFDQYWVDGLGNLYGGSWMSQPDIGWKALNPTGI